MTRELRRALHRLRRTPGFVVAALLTLALTLTLTLALALGIGANTLVFSAVRGILLRPLPLAGAERLAWVYGREGAAGGARGQIAPAEAQALAGLSDVFEVVAVFGDRGLVHLGRERPERWSGLWATPSLFAALDVRPALGRAFTLRGD